VKDRGPLSRRSSDTISNFINSSAKANLERLYHNAVTSKLSDDDDVTTSSLQELHKLQKQVQKVNQKIKRKFDRSTLSFSIQLIIIMQIHQSFDEHQV
jgi:hypothetical protein